MVVLTGLRATEARRLTWRWVEAAPPGLGLPAVLRVPAEAAKGRRERVVGLVPAALELLEAARRGRGDEEALMPGSHRRAFATAARRVGYSRTITLRDLRHCHATWAARGTGDAAAAQAALGHADLAVTQRYLTASLEGVAGAAVAVADLLAVSGSGDTLKVPRSYPPEKMVGHIG